MPVREALQELLQLHRYPFLLSFLPHSQRYHHLAPYRPPIPPRPQFWGAGVMQLENPAPDAQTGERSICG